MIKIGILGDIGSGKSYVANAFGYPVFDADKEVSKLYQKDKKIFLKLKKKLPNYIFSFPIKKSEISRAILSNNLSLKKIVQIIHPEIRKRMLSFIKKNKKRKIIILDIPLLLENKINKKKDILIFVQSKKSQINLRLKKRKNYNKKILENLRKLQKKLSYKKKICDYIIKNDFKFLTVKKKVKHIKEKILNERNSIRY